MLKKDINNEKGRIAKKHSCMQYITDHKTRGYIKYAAFILSLTFAVTISASATVVVPTEKPTTQGNSITQKVQASDYATPSIVAANAIALTATEPGRITRIDSIGQSLGAEIVDCTNYMIAIGLGTEQPKTSIYNEQVPLSEDLQLYLYDLCEQRGLDYIKVLGVIQTESRFDSDVISKSNDYGLCQINICNHKSLTRILETENKPLDPKTNLNWGTYLLSYLQDKYSEKYEGDTIWEATLSAYNKGEDGFKKYGMAKAYIGRYYESLDIVNTWF